MDEIQKDSFDSVHGYLSCGGLPKVPLTLEQFARLDIPAELSGELGANRSKSAPCQIDASTDLAAIWTWLEEFAESPKTFRAYRKEVERFYNWAIFVAQRALSSITIGDLSRYELFLADPQPVAFWVASKKQQQRALRGHANWRPFEKGLERSSIRYACVVLGALFSYLRDVGYLFGSPFAARRLKSKRGAPTFNGRVQPTRQVATAYLPLTTLALMLSSIEAAIEAIPSDDYQSRSKLERMLFTSRFLANTGLRRDEMANVVMSDVYARDYRGERSWFIHVVGKGGVVREVPFIEKARDALARYLQFYGHAPQHIGNAAPMLLPLSGKAVVGGNLTDQTVYAIIKESLRTAAAKIGDVSPDDTYLLKRASPHKFRHTFATVLTEQHGVSIKMMSEILGHNDVNTTAIYTHTALNTAFTTIDKAGI